MNKEAGDSSQWLVAIQQVDLIDKPSTKKKRKCQENYPNPNVILPSTLPASRCFK
jgi:hypothetical protein